MAALTGAGVSAESGIATFRDPGGLWQQFNPRELASIEGFMSNPDRVWAWYESRRSVIDESRPNPGHYALARMEELFKSFTLITQNIDRLHARAGSHDVVELHGNIVDNRCFKCHRPYVGETRFEDGSLPRCESCGGLVRPAVVWFGENLPEEALIKAEAAAENAEVFFSIGTSADVYPAAGLPLLAKRRGAFVVEINVNRTSLTPYADAHLMGTSGEVLPKLLADVVDYRNNRVAQ